MALHRMALAVAIAAALGACSSSSPSASCRACHDDADCPAGGESCHEGVCVPDGFQAERCANATNTAAASTGSSSGSTVTGSTVTGSSSASGSSSTSASSSSSSSGASGTSGSSTGSSGTTGSCVTSDGTWQATALASQSASFTFSFDATPAAAGLDVVVGLLQGTPADFTDLAAIVWFAPSGSLQVRNGGAYAADVNVPYAAGSTYHVRMVVDPDAHLYNVFVAPPGGAELELASGYAFRAEQSGTSAIDHWAMFRNVGSSGDLQVCGAQLGGGATTGTTATGSTGTGTSTGSTTGSSTTGSSTTGTSGASITALSCAQSDVEAALAQAASGDTVVVPGPCSATWSALTIPDTLAVTLQGGTGGVTVDGTNALVVEAGALGSTRVTGLAFTGIGSPNDGDVRVDLSPTSAPFRVDHCTFTNTGQSIFLSIWGNGPGLVDHDTFTGGGASEEIHVFGDGPGDLTGWHDDVAPGGSDMVFIEDSSFVDTDSTYLCSGIQSYYGARTVVRHDSFYFCQVDQHGTAGSVGARWWEIYENDFYPQGLNQCCYGALRAGSGVLFNNREHGSPQYPPASITFIEEDTGAWPLAFQVGSGIHGDSDGHAVCGATNSSPAYAWGNDATISIGDDGTGIIALNRDYFMSPAQPTSMQRMQLATDSCATRYGYVAYPYPHPLQAGP